MTSATNIRILGTTDAICTCDCCGRTDLKRTIILQAGISEAISYLGTDCASRALGRRTSKGLMNEALDAQLMADRAAAIQIRAEQQQKERDERRARLLEMSRQDFGGAK